MRDSKNFWPLIDYAFQVVRSSSTDELIKYRGHNIINAFFLHLLDLDQDLLPQKNYSD